MPPPTPSKTFMTSELAGESACPTFSLGRREFLGLPFDRVRVLHQASPDFFHGSDGGLLGCGWEEGTSAILQLPRALGRDDDEAVGALFDVIGNGVHRVISQSLSHLSLPQFFQNSKLSRIGRTSSSIRALRSRSAFTMDAKRAADSSISRLIST